MSNGLGFAFLCSFPLACREIYPVVPGVSEGMVVPKEGKFQMMVLLMRAREDAGINRARRVPAGLRSHWVLMAWVMAVRVTTVHMVEGLLAPQLTQVSWQA